MTTWRYTMPDNSVVTRKTPDGGVESCLASVLPAGTPVEPYVAPPAPPALPDPIAALQAQVEQLTAALAALAQQAGGSP